MLDVSFPTTDGRRLIMPRLGNAFVENKRFFASDLSNCEGSVNSERHACRHNNGPSKLPGKVVKVTDRRRESGKHERPRCVHSLYQFVAVDWQTITDSTHWLLSLS